MTTCHIINSLCYTALCRGWRWVKRKFEQWAGAVFFACLCAGGIVPPAPAEAAQAHRQRAWFNLIICPINSQPAPKFQYVLSLPPGMFETIQVIDVNGKERECVWQTRDREAI